MTLNAISDSAANQANVAYRSAFKAWDHKASVRVFSSPKNYDWDDFSGYWVPLTEGSVLNHPMIPDGIKPKLSAYLLIGNLDFTYSLEQCLIAPVSANLVVGELLSQLPQAVKVDALKIQCDEAFHALQAYALTERVRHATGIETPLQLGSHFLRFVDSVVESDADISEDLVRFCAVAISELLITKSLRDDWRDLPLPQEIANFFHEHYKDEARHSVYFSWLLESLWGTWPQVTRDIVSELWPQLIDAYLDSEIHIARGALQHFDLPEAQIACIIDDIFYADATAYQTERRQSMEYSIEVFDRIKNMA